MNFSTLPFDFDSYCCFLILERTTNKKRFMLSLSKLKGCIRAYNIYQSIFGCVLVRFARQQMDETYDNSSHFDLIYLMLVWMAFLPTIICPIIYSMWIISG